MKKIYFILLLLFSNEITIKAQLPFFKKKFHFEINCDYYDTFEKSGYSLQYAFDATEGAPNFEKRFDYHTKITHDIRVGNGELLFIRFWLNKNSLPIDSTDWVKQKKDIKSLYETMTDNVIPVEASFTKEISFPKTVSPKAFIDELKSQLTNKSLETLRQSTNFELQSHLPLGTFIFYNRKENTIDTYTEPSLSKESLGIDESRKDRIDIKVSQFIQHDASTTAEFSSMGPLRALGLSLSNSKFSDITLILKNYRVDKLKKYGLAPRKIISSPLPNEAFALWFEKLKTVKESQLSDYKLYFVSNHICLDSLVTRIKNYKEFSFGDTVDLAVAQIFSFNQSGRLKSSKIYEENLTISDYLVGFEVDDLSSSLYSSAKRYNQIILDEKNRKETEAGILFYNKKMRALGKKILSGYSIFYKENNTEFYGGALTSPNNYDSASVEYLAVALSTFLELTAINDSSLTVAQRVRTETLRKNHNSLLNKLKLDIYEYNDYYNAHKHLDVWVQNSEAENSEENFFIPTVAAPDELTDALKRKFAQKY